MRTVYICFVIVLLLISRTALSQEIVLGLSKNEIGITAFFDGSEILVFGAIKPNEAIATNVPFDVIVTISSPRQPVTAWRKEKILPSISFAYTCQNSPNITGSLTNTTPNDFIRSYSA